MTKRRPAVVAASVATAVMLVMAPVAAEREVRFGPHDVQSVVFVAKSENKNQVHFALRLDADCLPLRPSPLAPYWKMREKGAGGGGGALEPLLPREVSAYGVRRFEIDGPRVVARLFAIHDRDIVFEAWWSDRGACEARAVTTIGGAPAQLHDVYVKLGFPFRVEYLLLQGRSLANGAVVRERLE